MFSLINLISINCAYYCASLYFLLLYEVPYSRALNCAIYAFASHLTLYWHLIHQLTWYTSFLQILLSHMCFFVFMLIAPAFILVGFPDLSLLDRR